MSRKQEKIKVGANSMRQADGQRQVISAVSSFAVSEAGTNGHLGERAQALGNAGRRNARERCPVPPRRPGLAVAAAASTRARSRPAGRGRAEWGARTTRGEGERQRPVTSGGARPRAERRGGRSAAAGGAEGREGRSRAREEAGRRGPRTASGSWGGGR